MWRRRCRWVVTITNPLHAGTGGAGGFGGGGGGGGGTSTFPDFPTPGQGGQGGFGGGNGETGEIYQEPVEFQNPAENGGGGGGAGFGGAIFIRSGGTLTIKDSVPSSGNSVLGGTEGVFREGSCPVQIAPPTVGGDGFGCGPDIFIMTGGKLIVDITRDVVLQNGICGGNPGVATTETLTKRGCAMLNLNGNNTFIGGTLVDAGELRIDGTILENVLVETDALLSGNFTINGGNLINNGTLAPGNAGVGQVVINGDLTNGPDSFTDIDITPISLAIMISLQ